MNNFPKFNKEALQRAKPEELLKEVEDWYYIAQLQASKIASIVEENNVLKQTQKFSLN